MKTAQVLLVPCMWVIMEIISWCCGRCTLKALDIIVNLSKLNNGVLSSEKISYKYSRIF